MQAPKYKNALQVYNNRRYVECSPRSSDTRLLMQGRKGAGNDFITPGWLDKKRSGNVGWIWGEAVAAFLKECQR